MTPRLVLDLVTSTCMGNGEWEPNPSDFNCSGCSQTYKYCTVLITISVHADTIMIASMITTSQELDSYNFQLVTVLGSVLGVICLILLFLSAIIIVLFVIKTNKVKGKSLIIQQHIIFNY